MKVKKAATREPVKKKSSQSIEGDSAEVALARIAECFLGFGVDPAENIAKLVQFCGEQMGSNGAMYDRVDGVQLTRLATWKVSADTQTLVLVNGDKGPDKVKMRKGDIFEIEHVDVASHKRENYIGRIVKDLGNPVGALTLLYSQGKLPGEDARQVLRIVASAIAIEDKRLRAEEVIREQQAKIVSTGKASALGEMAAGVAHEVNNPLLVVLMRVEQLRDMLKEAKNLPEGVIKTLDSLDSMTLRISKIVKSLRAFSGDTEHEPFLQVPLQEILSRTVDLCGERFRQHRIELLIDSYEDGLSVQCRPTEISRVLLNLLYNSYDAIEGVVGAWIKIGVEKLSGELEISVTDSGLGIPTDIRDRIFLPFFSTKAIGRGKGLGLSVAKGMIEGHQGTLILDKKSKNTRFVIRIPLVQRG